MKLKSTFFKTCCGLLLTGSILPVLNGFSLIPKIITTQTNFSNTEGETSAELKYELNEAQDGYIVTGVKNLYSCDYALIPLNYLNKPVKAIGQNAFSNAYNLKRLTIVGSNLTSIGQEAFKNCYRLEIINFGKAINSVGENSFYGCNLKQIAFDTQNQTFDFRSNENDQGELIGGYIVAKGTDINSAKVVGNLAFGQIKITSNTIVDKAFFGCSGVNFIDFKTANLNIQGNQAFYLCKLTGFNYDETQSDATYTLQIHRNEIGLEDGKLLLLKDHSTSENYYPVGDVTYGAVNIPDLTTNIKDNAFKGCLGLTYVMLPEELTTIGLDAFAYTSLTNIDLQANNRNFKLVRNIISGKLEGGYISAMSQQPNQNSIVASLAFGNINYDNADVSKINTKYLNACYGVTSFTIPNYISDITQIIVDCPNLERINVTWDDTSIKSLIANNWSVNSPSKLYLFHEQNQTFDNLKSLYQNQLSQQDKYFALNDIYTDGNDLDIEWNVDRAGFISPVFKQQLHGEILIPDKVNNLTVGGLKANAFNNNLDITSVSLPETIKKVGSETFANDRNLKEVRFPTQLISIGAKAFYDCDLEIIDFPKTLEEIGNEAFSKNQPKNLFFSWNNEQARTKTFDWNQIAFDSVRNIMLNVEATDATDITKRNDLIATYLSLLGNKFKDRIQTQWDNVPIAFQYFNVYQDNKIQIQLNNGYENWQKLHPTGTMDLDFAVFVENKGQEELIRNGFDISGEMKIGFGWDIIQTHFKITDWNLGGKKLVIKPTVIFNDGTKSYNVILTSIKGNVNPYNDIWIIPVTVVGIIGVIGLIFFIFILIRKRIGISKYIKKEYNIEE